MDLSIADPDLRALAQGESIVAFVADELTEGMDVTLRAGGPRRADELKPAYRRWATAGPPDGTWTAQVDRVVPVDEFEPDAGDARHILASLPSEGRTLAVLRVRGPGGPVLTDAAYAARRHSLDPALGS